MVDQDGIVAAPPAEKPTMNWEQRILQLAGKRYSLRLETSFWDALDEIALRRRTRLNRLVGEVASRAGAANLASSLRVFCLATLREDERARRHPAERTSLLSLLRTAPAPGVLAEASQRILAVNDAFLGWINLPAERFIDTPLLRHFRFRFGGGRSFETLWPELGRGWTVPETARLINIEPGRVLAANVRMVPIGAEPDEALCLLWIAK